MTDREEWAAEAVRLALARGATGAECTVTEGDEFSASVRMGEVEKLTEAGSCVAGIRILTGQRTGSSYTSDLTPLGRERMVAGAIELARITTEDPYAGLPEPRELGRVTTDLELFSEDVSTLSTEYKIEQARATEQAALSFDRRIQNSEGASFDSYIGRHAFANSLGFSGSYQTSSCSLTAVPVAQDDGSMERDWWMTAARKATALERAEHVGRMAAQRAIRRLGARKIPTQKAPVLFEARTARSLVSDLFDAVNGTSIYRNASFLAGKLGERIGSERLTLIDDATIPGLFGTSPFDDEGVTSRRTVVIDRGVLTSYLLNSYSARKLGLKTTGNASRGVTGNSGVGPGNLYIAKGDQTPAALIASLPRGLYVTELIGSGTNTVTGDFSCGAAGLWIERGELAYPVSEVTVAGNLKEMMMAIELVANDLEFRGSIASPAILIGEMTISGA
jgi:PmbA protein